MIATITVIIILILLTLEIINIRRTNRIRKLIREINTQISNMDNRSVNIKKLLQEAKTIAERRTNDQQRHRRN